VGPGDAEEPDDQIDAEEDDRADDQSLRREGRRDAGDDRQQREPEDGVADAGDRAEQRELQALDGAAVLMLLFHGNQKAHQESDQIRMRIDEFEVVGHGSRQPLFVVTVDLFQIRQLREQPAAGLHSLIGEGCLQQGAADAQHGDVVIRQYMLVFFFRFRHVSHLRCRLSAVRWQLPLPLLSFSAWHYRSPPERTPCQE